MKIFKFGGASVKDAAGVQRIKNILSLFQGEEIMIVISAMGKTTNALEGIVQSFVDQKDNGWEADFHKLKEYHFTIIGELLGDKARVDEIEDLFLQLETILSARPKGHFNQVYDQIVSFGELLSTKIVSIYLNQEGFDNQWLDARKVIRTDQNHRAARVNWPLTRRLLNEHYQEDRVYLTQGFIGSDDDRNPTTLGREGSDYTASVLGYLLNAEEVIIWKDVPGVLNGDPKVFSDSKLLHQISYREAIELAFYGASVIHPKTIQPLQEKKIPLFVRSFINPEGAGTKICEGLDLVPFQPCFIRKTEQVLLKLSTRDLAFIAEDHLSQIYQKFHQYGLRVNLSQHAATSSAFCLNHDKLALPQLSEELAQTFDLSREGDLSLFTVRHPNAEALEQIRNRGMMVLEQQYGNTYQIVLREQ